MLDLDRWEHKVRQVCGGFQTQPHSYIPFIGEIQLQSYGGLEVAHIETNAFKINRSNFTLEDCSHYFVILQQKGTMLFSSLTGEQLELNPGEIALIDSSAHYSMQPQGLIKQMSVHIPKSILKQFKTKPTFTFSKLTQHHTSGKMLLTILRQLTYSEPSEYESSGQGKAIQQAISALIEPSIGSDHTPLPSLKNLARQHILRLLPEESLCPERLALEMNISKRSLYRLFSSEGESVSRLILQLRIEQCCKEIVEADMDNTPLSLTEVAFRWGFSDASQFSRAFKRVKGVAPSVWREEEVLCLSQSVSQ